MFTIWNYSIIVTLASKDGILHIANLGDCGLRLLREGFTPIILYKFVVEHLMGVYKIYLLEAEIVQVK